MGCGVGNTVFPLLETNRDPGLFVYGSDFSETAVRIVRQAPQYDPQRSVATRGSAGSVRLYWKCRLSSDCLGYHLGSAGQSWGQSAIISHMLEVVFTCLFSLESIKVRTRDYESTILSTTVLLSAETAVMVPWLTVTSTLLCVKQAKGVPILLTSEVSGHLVRVSNNYPEWRGAVPVR